MEAAASFFHSRAGREALVTVLGKAKEGIENGVVSEAKGRVDFIRPFSANTLQHFFIALLLP